MQRKDVEFEQLSDIIAFRIVSSTAVEDCYRALGAIHSAYAGQFPASFKDYVSACRSRTAISSIHTCGDRT